MGNAVKRMEGNESINNSIKKSTSDEELEKMVDDITRKNIKLCLYRNIKNQ